MRHDDEDRCTPTLGDFVAYPVAGCASAEETVKGIAHFAAEVIGPVCERCMAMQRGVGADLSQGVQYEHYNNNQRAMTIKTDFALPPPTLTVALKQGWDVFRRFRGRYVGILLIFLVFMIAPEVLLRAVLGVVSLPAAIVIRLLFILVGAIVSGGVYRTLANGLDGRTPRVADLFWLFHQPQLWGLALLRALPGMVLTLVMPQLMIPSEPPINPFAGVSPVAIVAGVVAYYLFSTVIEFSLAVGVRYECRAGEALRWASRLFSDRVRWLFLPLYLVLLSLGSLLVVAAPFGIVLLLVRLFLALSPHARLLLIIALAGLFALSVILFMLVAMVVTFGAIVAGAARLRTVERDATTG